MKVLFAVNNEKSAEQIIKKYQQEYKQIISSKTVYYFNAISAEIQKDKSYDRIVISEDLEPFTNNNFEVIDKFIFEKLDNISDDAISSDGQDIPIILICADRRSKSDSLLVKLFGIGVYSALLGQDRSIVNVCRLINQPRNKKDSKTYYRIDADDVGYVSEGESDVSEVEIQNILNHYKKLGKKEELYEQSFENIAKQYTEQQLTVIVKFFPPKLKTILELNSKKYQELVEKNIIASVSPGNKSKKGKTVKVEDVMKTEKKELIEKNIGKSNLTQPVIIPGVIDTSKTKKEKVEDIDNVEETKKVVESKNEIQEVPEKKKRGRKPKNVTAEVEEAKKEEVISEEPPKRRGRPKKVVDEVEKNKVEVDGEPPKRRGRPKKVVVEETVEEIESSEILLPGFDDVDDNKEDNIILPGFNKDESTFEETASSELEEIAEFTLDLENLLTREKKIVSFIGTSKNGTSFTVNNLAEYFSSKGIKTAILDLTKNKNAYYIYTNNREDLRSIASSCMNNLKEGVCKGIEVNKNLTVFTSLPESDENEMKSDNILKTIVKNYSLILMDCDYDTDFRFFRDSQEIYLVQSYDVLTIQPLTAFLRNLKAKNILNQEKLKIVLNKSLKFKTINDKAIIGGMSSYKDPAMAFMTELFDKDMVRYSVIPFEEQTYARYLDCLVRCEMSLKGYPKKTMQALTKLSNMVYPLLDSKK